MARYNEYGVSKLALFAAAAPSLVKRPYFPYGIDREVVINIIEGTYKDRPKMLQGFGEIFFFSKCNRAFLPMVLSVRLQAASMGHRSYC